MLLSENPKILVVDDKEENLLVMTELLEGFDANVITSLSGNDALAKTLKHDFALVIMDVQMPVMDGMETASIMRTQVNVPIIFVTAISAESKFVFKGYEAGAVDYLLKPFEPEILISKVRVFLDLYEQKALLKNEITERKKVEQALIQSEKLKSIGIITAGISHEYNNILGIISGNVQILEMEHKDNSKLMGMLRIIMKAVDDGASISKRMLEFTRSGKDSSGFVSSDINDLLKQSLEFTMPRWKNMAQANGIDYCIDRKDMKPVSLLLCRPTEIREVFVNIINNALDAMPDGGSVSLGTWSNEDTLFVRISDTGKGMTEEVQNHIFDPFYTTRCPEGIGLGLSMAYGIINRHGGKIDVKSELGRGSTFTLQFQMTTETVKAVIPEKTDRPEAKGRELRILVVDDEEDVRGILDIFLSKIGHKVRTVDNGADAIELAKQEGFDLVLSDLVMPNVYGYDVIKALNKLDKVPKIGIITGWGEELKSIDDEDFKVDFILKKPFKYPALAKYINELFI